MAEEQFSNNVDLYTEYQIIDTYVDKQTVIKRFDAMFSKSKKEDINYLIINSHGNKTGIVDFSYFELKSILDQYDGHFVIVISAFHSGAATEVFNQQKNENSTYNIYCSSTKDQYAFSMEGGYSLFLRMYYRCLPNLYFINLYADYNGDNIITANELAKYLSDEGIYTENINGKTYTIQPVSYIEEPNLSVFAKDRQNSIVKSCYRISDNSCLYSLNNSQFSRDSNIAILPKFCIDNGLVKGLNNNSASDDIFLYDSRLINVPIPHQFLIHSTDEEDYFAISSSDNQRWLLPENSNEGATIKGTTEKQKAGIWKVVKSSTEIFTFEFVKQNSTAKSYDSAGLVLDVKGSEVSNCNPLILWKNNNTSNQKFKLFLPEDQHFINDIISTWRYFYIGTSR
ncbi:RICIN domain-containing protein [Enterococcus avium]|uniref:RICIN domain-containing protein n=1 Tax=Enterococcus avium TaxID=33945 RepID=UPI001F5AF588|nr:RICIN domain-containing protein [Enterococcus avium]